MKKFILKFIIVLFILSCTSSPSSKIDNTKLRNSQKDSNLSKGISLSHIATNDTTGFLSNCKLLMTRSYEGALQVESAINDSVSYLCFAACYSCKKSYEIIFVYKGEIEIRKSMGYDSLGKIFEKGCYNNFSKFNCFAFMLPMLDPEKQEDIHAMNIDFPVIVRVYKRIENDNWQYIKTKKVKTFEDYTALQFNTIYSK